MKEATLTSALGIIPLGDGILTIGRAPRNRLYINRPAVSRHHAEIRLDEQGYCLIDLDSTSGTFVNGQRLSPHLPHPLRSGDTIQIGDFLLVYEVKDSALPASDPDATLTIDKSKAASFEPASASSPEKESEQEARLSSSVPAENLTQLEKYNPDVSDAVQQESERSYSGSEWSPVSALPEQDGLRGQPVNLAQEQLQFTAFYAGNVAVEEWYTLLVYAYIEPALEAVRADAARFKYQLGAHPFKSDAWASRLLSRGAQITVLPIFPGVTFYPERLSFTWTKDWHPALFSFNADKRLAGEIGSGEVLLFAGPLIIASLRLSLRFSEQGVQINTEPEEVSVSRYRKIFTSYSHDDRPVVLAIRQAYEALGDESFIDFEDLRSGQNWNASLLRAIDSADIFQLFWSHHSAQSPYVYKECQYALQHYKYEGFIRPVYWEKPMRVPPSELSHLHFAYYELPKGLPAGVSPLHTTDKR